MNKKTQRKRKQLSLNEKKNIILEINNGTASAEIARRNNLSPSTISIWKKNSHVILQNIENIQGNKNQRKSIKQPKNDLVDAALHKWFDQRRALGDPISGPILCEKALELNTLLPNPNALFKASSGWLEKFKKRYSIQEYVAKSEKLSADFEAITKFKVVKLR
jgi:transcriptional regulator with XRE-family HTH domain